MNKLRLLLVLSLSMFMFFGCKKWGEPEFGIDEWEVAGPSQLWPIGPHSGHRYYVLREMSTPPKPIVPPAQLSELRYLRAVVVSSDEGGNYYKSIVLQDSTRGVEMQLDMTGLHTIYPVGQKVVIVLNELVVGSYNNLPQIGWLYNDQVGRINSLYFDKYIIRDGMPSLNNLPKPLTNNEINFSDPSNPRDVNKLVRLEGVTFQSEAIGEPLAYNRFTTNWIVNVPLASGTSQKVTVRTSNFARFRSTIIEEKEYNLTGILTIFGDTYQLMLRTKDDIQTAQPTESVTFAFNSNPIGEGGWSIQSFPGTTRWGFRENAIMHFGNGVFGHDIAMDDWFISPVITYQDLQNGYLQFEHQLSVLNEVYDAYQVYYTTSNTTNFNPDDWKSLGNITVFPASFGWSNQLPISNINANSFRIAFRYNAANPDIETYEWRIRRMEIRNK
ncbi:MAG: DUF5689 domain-containing protein [Bacteroidetes bacterium]|nr:DUF5689 domain-containing protein [Bacteroidota bacterium]MCL2303384.1 DUF5689 domain-containing protein [Lentimicrobiaceae bacterium]